MNLHSNARLTLRSRADLVEAVTKEGLTLKRVAARFRVSECTAAKWVGRFRREGRAGLQDRSSGACTTKIHLVAANARCALMLKLSPGQARDTPHGRELLRAGGPAPPGCPPPMDRAYEVDETHELARELGCEPVVPPNPKRLNPWPYDRAAYWRCNDIERLFQRL